MIRYEAHTTVASRPDEVFAAVVDIATWSTWTDMADIRTDGSGPVRVGSSGSFTLSKGPFRGPLRYETVRLEAGRGVAYRISHPAMDWIAELHVAPEGGGTRLSTTGSVQLKGLYRLLQPMIGREIQRSEAGELARLKELLESPPTQEQATGDGDPTGEPAMAGTE